MDRQQSSHSMPLPQQPAPRQSRGKQLWRIAIPTSLFLFGMVFGIIALLISLFVISGNRSVLSTAQSPQRSDILVQAGNQYITHLVQRNLQASGLVNASNVAVTMVQGDQMTISGDEQILFGVSRPFSVIVQPIFAPVSLRCTCFMLILPVFRSPALSQILKVASIKSYSRNQAACQMVLHIVRRVYVPIPSKDY
jgi:hypothetical protein